MCMLGCSPLYGQSLLGIVVPPIIIPIRDCLFQGGHPDACMHREYLNNTMEYDVIECNAMQYNVTSCNTV